MTEKEQDDQFINTYMLTNDEDQSSVANAQPTCISHIKIIPFIISIFMILIGLVNMIFFYAYPMIKIKENKKNMPDAIFAEPTGAIVFLHFFYTSSVVICGVSVLLFALRGFFIRRMSILVIFIIVSSSLSFILYVTYFTIVYTVTEGSDNSISVDELVKIVNKGSPLNLAFVYSKEMVSTHVCSQNPATAQMSCTTKYLYCYSKNGVAFPLISQNLNTPYDASNNPSLFYFTIEQKINQSSEYKQKFNEIYDKIEDCNYEDKVIEYYPIVNQTMLVSFGKIPFIFTTKGRRITSSFGVGIYYELMTKSIPLITYKQRISVDLLPNFDYDSLWNSKSCQIYGECDPYNTKPEPVVNY